MLFRSERGWEQGREEEGRGVEERRRISEGEVEVERGERGGTAREIGERGERGGKREKRREGRGMEERRRISKGEVAVEGEGEGEGREGEKERSIT